MRVGITYDLRDEYLAQGHTQEQAAEFDKPETIEAIEVTLQELGYCTDRIGNAHRLMERLLSGERWDLVFNIAEGLRGFGREALVPALLDAYRIPYTFSDPLVLTLTLHKAMAKRVVRDLGVPTADFTVIEKEHEVELVDLPYPLFLKPVAEGTGKGITASSRVESPAELRREALRLLNSYEQPVLVETFLPGREFTVGILGSRQEARAIGVMEVLIREGADAQVYSYLNKEECERFVHYRLIRGPEADEAAQVALRAWTGLGCHDAGRVDVRQDALGRVQFLEANPLAGLHPDHSDLPMLCKMAGLSYRDLIGSIMESALRRTRLTHPELGRCSL